MRSGILLLALFVSACAPATRNDGPPAWVDRNQALSNWSSWSFNGRISLQLTDKGFNGTLRWEQIDDELQADFSGPFGAGAFRISGRPDALVLQTGDESYLLSGDAENVLEAELGWSVPIAAMPYWLVGLAHPDFPAQQQFGPDGQLASIEQLDWQVSYERYSLSDGWLMPRKMHLLGGKDVRIKLILNRWNIQLEPVT